MFTCSRILTHQRAFDTNARILQHCIYSENNFNAQHIGNCFGADTLFKEVKSKVQIKEKNRN